MTSLPLRAPADEEGFQSRLFREYGALDGSELLRVMIEHEFKGRIAVTSSFGAESAVLLHMVAGIDPTTPVIFLNTGQLFSTTISYQQVLRSRLGLSDVRMVSPERLDIIRTDPHDTLWRDDPDACCHLRKVVPLAKALEGFEAWVTGRKRFHGNQRTGLPAMEFEAGKVKINPLIHWPAERMEAAFEEHDLPRHPLAEVEGYTSIGCHTCTHKPGSGGGRSGRWAGTEKTECGIHQAKWNWAGENI